MMIAEHTMSLIKGQFRKKHMSHLLIERLFSEKNHKCGLCYVFTWLSRQYVYCVGDCSVLDGKISKLILSAIEQIRRMAPAGIS